MAASKSGCGRPRSKTTLRGPRAVIWAGSSTKGPTPFHAPVCIVSSRVYEATTASASHGEPSWNVTPSRRWNVQRLWSSLDSQDSAINPSYSSVALPLRTMSPSYKPRMATTEFTSYWECGSKSLGEPGIVSVVGAAWARATRADEVMGRPPRADALRPRPAALLSRERRPTRLGTVNAGRDSLRRRAVITCPPGVRQTLRHGGAASYQGRGRALGHRAASNLIRGPQEPNRRRHSCFRLCAS